MGDRVTIREAAGRLGVSVDTVRRRLKSGVLRGERVPGQYGPTWFVVLPDETGGHDDASQVVPPVPGAEVSQAVALALELTALNAELRMVREWNEQLRGELEGRGEEVRRRDAIIAQLAATVESLSAPQRALPQPTATVMEPGALLQVPSPQSTDVANVLQVSEQAKVAAGTDGGHQSNQWRGSQRRTSRGRFARLWRLVRKRLSFVYEPNVRMAVVLSLAVVVVVAVALSVLFSTVLH